MANISPSIFPEIQTTIESLRFDSITNERREILRPLIEFLREKRAQREPIRLNFICTHNSRRSHLSQVWAQLAAAYYDMPRVECYSGGTEATALFPSVAQTLAEQGFVVFKISEGVNPVYAIKYGAVAMPVIGFSKTYDSVFNPTAGFAAVMNCSEADGACPFVAGAEKRISVMYEDPKISDNTPHQREVYMERSLQIATEMFFAFSEAMRG